MLFQQVPSKRKKRKKKKDSADLNSESWRFLYPSGPPVNLDSDAI